MTRCAFMLSRTFSGLAKYRDYAKERIIERKEI